MKRLILLVTLAMTVHTATCQTGIDYKRLMQDVLRLDSCIEKCIVRDSMLWYKDSLLMEKTIYIHELEKLNDSCFDMSRNVIRELNNCGNENIDLHKDIIKKRQTIKYLFGIIGIETLLLLLIL